MSPQENRPTPGEPTGEPPGEPSKENKQRKFFGKTIGELFTDFWAKVVVGLAAALSIAVVSSGVTWAVRDQKHQQRLNAAPRLYVEELERLINQAIKDGPKDAIINGRAIVNARNSLAGSLESVTINLNGEINTLAQQVGGSSISGELLHSREDRREFARPSERPSERPSKQSPERSPERSPEVGRSPEAVYETIRGLSKSWPAKRIRIDVQIRRMLAELGLYTTDGSAYKPIP